MNPTPAWIKFADDYYLFCDGCHQMILTSDIKSLKDARKWKDWMLVSLLHDWNNAIEVSLSYGNRSQIKEFVPIAKKTVNLITDELLRRKQYPRAGQTRTYANPTEKLDARAVKMSVDPMIVFEKYFPDMQKNGGKLFKAKCRWHDDSKPSLTIYPQGAAHCFSCGAHKDIYDLVMEFERVSFPQAVSIVKQWANIV